MKKVLGLLLGLALVLGPMASCGQGTPDTAPADAPSETNGGEESPKVIGAALLTQTHVFYQDLVAAMEEEAAARGMKLRVQYCDFDGAKQNAQMKTFVLQEVDAIVVSPPDSAAIAAAINEATAQGIPVFTVDIAAHGVEVVSHIASDNVQGGRLVGEYLAKLLNGKGKVAIIDQPETASVQERTQGFVEALSAYPEMEIVQRVQGGGVRDQAHRAAQDVLQANPELDAIFGINDDSALGALAAVESAGLQDQIAIVGYDGTPEARAAIKAGKALKADTVQYPDEMGRETIRTIAAYLAGEEVPKVVPVEVGLIDEESLKAEETQ